ncbi:MAG: Flp pilus assembly protein CpaB [Candidatus Omnitrophota bacterium]|jgi:pilus assembly protein CpaB
MRLPFQLQKQQVILIVGIALAILAVFMIKVYLDEQRKVIQEKERQRIERIQANQTAVLVAKRDIPRGAVIEPDTLEAKIVPNQFVQPGAVTSLDRVSGMTTIAPIARDEQIILSKLTFQRASDLAGVTPAGKRAITISVDNVASLAGMLRAGDYVDVVTVVPVPMQTADGKPAAQITTFSLFQNIRVLAVGQQVAESAKEETRYRREPEKETTPLITLALSPQEANIVAFIQEQQGRFRLVLRSPTDAKVEPVAPVDWPTVLQYVMPQSAKAKEGPPPAGQVEIYRGLNRETVPLYK